MTDELVTVRNRRLLEPIQAPMEDFILLYEKPVLYAFLITLKYLQREGKLNLLTQDQLAKEYGIKRTTFLAQRDALAETKLITLHKEGKRIFIDINEARLNYGEIKRLKGYPFFPGLPRYQLFRKLANHITIHTPEYKKQQAEEAAIEEKVQERVKQIKKAENPRNQVSFPNEDYEAVLLEYKKWKHVGLVGHDNLVAKKEIKNMFLSGHTVKEIRDCIQLFAKVQNIAGNEWMKMAGLAGVRKKMAEFKAGTLHYVKRMEDDYEDY